MHRDWAAAGVGRLIVGSIFTQKTHKKQRFDDTDAASPKFKARELRFGK